MRKVEKIFITAIKNRIAEISVGSSSIRNQGAPGLIKISRSFFKKIDLKKFRRKVQTTEYTAYLDNLTLELLKEFPKKGRQWGAARKGLNLFFREVSYNHYLAHYLDISSSYNENLVILKNLEVPLDKDVATGLIECCDDLPKWKSIKSLTQEVHTSFQNKAKQYAEETNTISVHLDLTFWRR